ncbi:MAG TPA: NAD(P)/FAD-dependent oxidoreductase [Pyrinomonadaceae bacterium]|nr:NAD(P)/FAD-dependent oxidoreductase [Pyrinomonadaceae bacterium]
MDDEADILIVGAGAAGLAAARELSAEGLKVIVLEARNRIGGRINTHLDKFPVELGAEFIHGKPRETLSIVEHSKLTLQKVPNLHWYIDKGILTKSSEFWSKVEDVMEKMSGYAGPDECFAQFLTDYKRKTQIEDIKTMATLYVEGFHAADVDKISVHGLNKTNKAAEQVDDEKQFRVQDGYSLIAQTLHDDAVAAGATFQLNTVVDEVRWKRNHVDVITNASIKFKARLLLITLPLSLLQKGEVRFTPALTEKQRVVGKLAMGHVVKVVLRFREPFWKGLAIPAEGNAPEDLKKFTFIHAPHEPLPTWWTQYPLDAPLLAGWAGGPRAEKLAHESDDSLLDHSLQVLTHILQTPKSFLEGMLEAFYTHNWHTDPFSTGAYSYIPVGGIDSSADLARPLDNTLFFAGEATSTEGHQGTVHGAIATGLRAAREITRT